MQCAGARQTDTGASFSALVVPMRAAWRQGPADRTRGDVGLRRPGVSGGTVAVLDDRRAVVMPRARFGEGEGSGAKGAFRREPTDQPMRPAATGAMVDFMFPVHGMIAAALGIVLETKVTKSRELRHRFEILSAHFNGGWAAKVPLGSKHLDCP